MSSDIGPSSQSSTTSTTSTVIEGGNDCSEVLDPVTTPRSSSPPRVANQPDTAKGADRRTYWKPDPKRPETVDMCRAIVQVCPRHVLLCLTGLRLKALAFLFHLKAMRNDLTSGLNAMKSLILTSERHT